MWDFKVNQCRWPSLGDFSLSIRHSPQMMNDEIGIDQKIMADRNQSLKGIVKSIKTIDRLTMRTKESPCWAIHVTLRSK